MHEEVSTEKNILNPNHTSASYDQHWFFFSKIDPKLAKLYNLKFKLDKVAPVTASWAENLVLSQGISISIQWSSLQTSLNK